MKRFTDIAASFVMEECVELIQTFMEVDLINVSDEESGELLVVKFRQASRTRHSGLPARDKFDQHFDEEEIMENYLSLYTKDDIETHA